jgi:hypothetical protein
MSTVEPMIDIDNNDNNNTAHLFVLRTDEHMSMQVRVSCRANERTRRCHSECVTTVKTDIFSSCPLIVQWHVQLSMDQLR